MLYPTFKYACYAFDFLDDDKEWYEAINQVSHWASGKQICELFVIKLMFREVAEPYILWTSNWKLLSEDILHRKRRVVQYKNLQVSDSQLQNYALCDIERLLNKS